jgi:GntR family transcriptional regulator, transcriptional repressor for pyruvate dehydrogenase complex
VSESRAASRVIGQKVLRPRQQVEETVRGAILSGDLKPGEMLPPETELARQFNVSRTTVREALRVLSTQNLITKVPGARGGNFVRSVDHRALSDVVMESFDNLLTLGTIEFREVAQVRQLLEVPAARLASEHRSQDHLDGLTRIVERQKSASVDDPDVPGMDAEFHGLLADASGNRVLASFVQALHHATEPVNYLDLSPEVGRETVKQHAAIVRAVAEQDADAAERAVVTHLTYLREHLAPHVS